MRLIDGDALKRKVQKVATESWKMKTKANVETILNQFIDLIDAEPTIEERKTGTFIGTEYDGYADGNPVFYEWRCSECGCVFEDEEPTYNFCPNCGSFNGGGSDDQTD